MSERKQVVLTARFEYGSEITDEYSDDELIDMAKEAFYDNGARVSATAEPVDG